MRPIDADALHETLKTKQKWVVRCGDKHNEGYTYDQVHFAIDEAPTIEAVSIDDYRSMANTCYKLQKALETAMLADRPQGWIPCSERLPKENTEVLMSLEWGIDIGECRNGDWHSEWINHYDDDDVLAWMPLPEPWKGARNEANISTL